MRVIDTAEHNDHSMATVLSERFALDREVIWEPPADERERLAWTLRSCFEEIQTSDPDVVMLIGDGYGVALFSLAARRSGLPIVRLAPALPSSDDTAALHRMIAEQAASLHLLPGREWADRLETSGVERSRISVVGNSIVDALRLVGASKRPPSSRAGVLMSIRDPAILHASGERRGLVQLLLELSSHLSSVTYLMPASMRAHLLDPRDRAALRASQVRLLQPLPFDGSVELLATSRVVVTDSNDLHEEAAWLGVPLVFVSRTARTGAAGVRAHITSGEIDEVTAVVRRCASDEEQQRAASRPFPYGKGEVGHRIADVLANPDKRDLLSVVDHPTIGDDSRVQARERTLVT